MRDRESWEYERERLGNRTWPLIPAIFDLPKIYINGGRRGFLVGVVPVEIERVLKVMRVEAALLE